MSGRQPVGLHRFQVGPLDESATSEAAGETAGDGARPRLDRFLLSAGLALSRSQIKRLIEEGRVVVGGARAAKPGQRLSPGDEIAVDVPPPAAVEAVPQAMDLTILYEDQHLIVIDKPAGLVVHPAPGHPDGTLVNALLAHCRDLSGIGGALRPGIVHRLDKDTSGVMLASKTDAAHQKLVKVFQEHALHREYLALVAPPPAEQAGRFATLHGRHPRDRKKFSSRVSRGKSAVTHWRVVEHVTGPVVERDMGRVPGGRAAAAVVRCRLETGRTHQIRVHFADHGSPVVGDPLYGRKPRHPAVAAAASQLRRQALHATLLALAHPITGVALRFESPLPPDMVTAIERIASGT